MDAYFAEVEMNQYLPPKFLLHLTIRNVQGPSTPHRISFPEYF